jgi:tetratricopeptide (TPR) repeat protein
VARGRYRIEERLGRGGAAAVYRALEVASGRHFAVKRLIGDMGARVVSLFELEYHTLSSLRHPNIVEVYDYGTDEEGPYYVMELLEGADLSDQGRLEWREAATYACQVASALSLLHARRLIHRDVSARNVWRLPTGRLKLIDFGALTAFGSPGHIVGTPPHVAPEAMFGRPLDQRTDLYGLGALLYWLLTGSHAYPARSLRDLPALWTQPIVGINERLSRLGPPAPPEVPPELDGLVMSLLSENPMARPSTTGEVIDRLSALLGVESEARDVSDIALEQPGLVGRERERRYLRRQLKLLHQGRGESTVYVARRGEGRSRLLLEFATDARIFGVSVLHVQAKSCSGPHGVAEALVQHLLDALPELAQQAARTRASVLGHLSRRVQESLGGVPLFAMPAVAGEARARIHEALGGLFASVAQQAPLLLLIDDLESADESSVSWLAALAERLGSVPILLGFGLCEADVSDDAYAQRALRQHSRRVVLKPLSGDETHKLLASLFGEVPHLVRLSERIHRRTHGVPARVVAVACHLVREGLISNADGTWVLPQDLPDEQLAIEHDESVRAAMGRLSPAARSLGALLSLQRGLIPLEVCKILGNLPAKELFAALEELVSEGVLTSVPGGYLFEDPLFVSALNADLSSEDAKRTHQNLGEFLLSQEPSSPAEELDALVHVMQGGDEVRAPARITRIGVDLIKQDPDRAIEAVPALERALKLFRALGKQDTELVGLLVPLATSGYFADRRLAQRYGEQALGATARVLGIDLMIKWAPWLGRRLSLAFGMLFGALRFRLSSRFAPTFRERIELFFNAMGSLAAVSAICLDRDAVARCARLSEPFKVLGKNHIAGFIHEFNLTLLSTVSERLAEARERWQGVLAQLEGGGTVGNMPDQLRLRYLGGALYGLGVLESFRDSPEALKLADRLESFEIKLYHMMADQVRTVYYANQGNRELYERYRSRAELHAIQRGSAWQVETWAPGAAITASLRTYDAMSLKESYEQLRRLERRIPSLALLARRCRGAYLYLRKRYQEALPVLEDCLKEVPLGVNGWGRAHGVLAACLNGLGEHERAKQVAGMALAKLSPADLGFPAMNLLLQIELALAEAGLGNCGLAAQQLDALFAPHAAGDGRLTLGALHEARARVALLARNEAACELHATQMEQRYLATEIPSLVARCESFARERKRAFRPAHAREAEASGEVSSTFSAGPTTLERELSNVDGSLESHAYLGLSLLARPLGDVQAGLFLLRDQRVSLVAVHGKGELPRELQSWVEARLGQIENDDVTQTEIIGGDEGQDPDVFLNGTMRYRFFPLSAVRDVSQSTVGAAVFSEAEGVRHFVGLGALQVVAQRLFRDMDPNTTRSSVASIRPRSGD